ncbi:pseudouridine synthase [Cantharellus anzutake]|uniref:pseudouridine synthase n=1 Tax=Cantharellus anzutake TaxID=1750568 RepID=UPI001906A639|nr:pseudouridine synthase [Cantharellus anzutake]KAF8339021.1 pseudouridine synthase [Cantharellus anzutake]
MDTATNSDYGGAKRRDGEYEREAEPSLKRARVEKIPEVLSTIEPSAPDAEDVSMGEDPKEFNGEKPITSSKMGEYGTEDLLPPDVPAFTGIIKQRFTDFLVYEINLQNEVVRLKCIEKPESTSDQPQPRIDEATHPTTTPFVTTEATTTKEERSLNVHKNLPEKAEALEEPWPSHFDEKLLPLLPLSTIQRLKEMFLQGPTPSVPPSSESTLGNSSGVLEIVGTPAAPQDSTTPISVPETSASMHPNGKKGARGKGKDRGRSRSSRGRVEREKRRSDSRSVLSEPIQSKTDRTAFHQIIRDGGSGTRGDGPGSELNGTTAALGRSTRDVNKPQIPPFIHFTLHKANRDTQDALGHISRPGCRGTKDKRGVTTQRVNVWKMVNNVPGRRTAEEAVKARGERGVRIGDLEYRKAGLELGMLEGNKFVITLRNVKAESEDSLNRSMEVIKQKGFINYYGMQRFGTSSVPTHSIGLALLQSNWKRAIDLILRPRPDHQNLEGALSLMPRRAVAERSILEAFQKNFGLATDLQGALSAIPKNLRLMYVHAYQSYVWNAIVSERIRKYGCDGPVIGDLVLTNPQRNRRELEKRLKQMLVNRPPDLAIQFTHADLHARDDTGGSARRSKSHNAKVLTEEDLPHYTIYDVIMPLPGSDVAYPGGELGEKYKAFMRADGLDPHNLIHKRREYSLSGSYRKIMYLPAKFPDPEVPLAQSDEDKILCFESPASHPDGKFVALQIELELGSSVYATMALREVTKTETSAHYQTALTQSSEDQGHRGAALS